ncbi:hypothetical protein SAMN05421786_109104 [Chryseobacterium ureilyticum]|uniref:Uncharacterized protein n=1 Tax=Chryseobacterium ureilyticum TaxID=373668 RepID=A0A1N7QF52_9FLAO|nr:hypothetical protein SAMN05421786_109104 [Chryseobacterium ureilyticum]
MNIKILKVIVIISFLLICSIDQKGFPILITLIIYSFVAFQELFYYGNIDDIFWEGIIFPILIIGTLITFYKCAQYKDRYIELVCIIALFLSIIILTGILNSYNYYKRILPMSFIIPASIFIISSLILIVKNFRKSRE